MATQTVSTPQPTPVELKDPAFSAFLAWLWPGAGHLYQGRTAKGILFMASILGTFFYGFFLGDGRVVYASYGSEPFRWPIICQAGVGLPTLPALIEVKRAKAGSGPLFGHREWYRPPASSIELHQMLLRLHRYFELGTVFTMIAGLLNILAIYDAWGGPAYLERKKEDKPSPDEASPDKTEPKTVPQDAAT